MRKLLLFILALGVAAQGATYELGEGKALSRLNDVPWSTLQAGDTVLIYWKAEPYKERVLICTRATADAPITVRGMPGPEGQLPAIDGQDATTAPGRESWDNGRSVLQIGNADYEPGSLPAHITIENLDIRSGRPPYNYTAANGVKTVYAKNAAAIYVCRGESLVIRRCELHDSGNGLMIGSSDRSVSADILVEANYIHDNGIEGSIYEHNSYTAARGITFQYNRYGPLRPGAGGNNLKDRSVGMVIRYNWIESGNRQLDLVDAEDSVQLRRDPRYRISWVYGNVLIEPDGAGNRQIVHYGGDSGSLGGYRKGTLLFYNNTVASHRTDRTVLFRLSTNDEHCVARNNIFYTTAAGNTMALLESDGWLDFDHNWIKPGWTQAPLGSAAHIERGDSLTEGDLPGFEGASFHLAPGSLCIGAGERLPRRALPVLRQYVLHQAGEPRPPKNAPSLGAFEANP